ncbi:hypothetical protein VCUG_02626 [Vavraia culicis subsp. floridensis]|uniref:Microbial-type PARG catalytic domain-containing protein n=1 Tax=Vavraia culicis (isolate floridensis) TaxID=948595 RepID=L2GS38_VAVCU|nr:uncharacterized protein VCUG_02626 [Vavraia culicis subsp. floridensis]ELA45885.1 hypothetical protein VCUG_02626 [Vavraia culicis subsp. floridensis]
MSAIEIFVIVCAWIASVQTTGHFYNPKSDQKASAGYHMNRTPYTGINYPVSETPYTGTNYHSGRAQHTGTNYHSDRAQHTGTNYHSDRAQHTGINYHSGRAQHTGTNYHSGRAQHTGTNYPSGRAQHTGTNYPSGRAQHTGTNYPSGRAQHTSANPDKDIFFEKTRDYEYRTFKNAKPKPVAKPILFKIPRKNKPKPLVIPGKDSVWEMFRLISKNKSVAGNTAADSIYVGGGYSAMPKYRNGKGTQEEGAMALLSGLLTSLLPLAEKDKNGHFLRTDDFRTKGRFVYKPGTFSKNIWLSEGMYPRVSLNLWEQFTPNNTGNGFFTDHIASRYCRNKVSIDIDRQNYINIYSMVALDRRGMSQAEMDKKYNDLYVDTFGQISAMLKNALEARNNAIVITIPGSGVFSNIDRDPAKGKDERYLDIVEEATVTAIKIYGWDFDEIVLCGHRSVPKIFY